MTSLAQRPALAWTLAVVSLLAVLACAFCAGKYPIALSDLLRAVVAALTRSESDLSESAKTVLWNIRLPRIAAGVLVGAVLGAAGSAYQCMFRNPLVSPDILGVCAGWACVRRS